MSASRREWLLVLALAFALVTFLTFPTVPGFTTHGRVRAGDGQFSIWNIGWIGHALLTSPRHLFDANIFYPHTGTLAYSELNLVAGLFGLPAYAVTRNAVAALNAAVVVGLILSFVCMWAFVRRLTGSSGGGLVAGVAFTYCPFVLAHTAHIQLLMVFGFPLVFLAFHRLHAAPDWKRGVALGGALAGTALACAYYGIFAGLALGFLAIVLARRRPAYWVGLFIGVVVAAAIVAPVLLPYLRARTDSGTSKAFGVDELQGYSATLATYATSPSLSHQAFSQGAAESVFPGLLLLGLAVAGAVVGARSPQAAERRTIWAYLSLAGFAAWASFGPKLGLYSLLASFVPMMSLLRTPVRLGIVVVFALAVLAAFAVRHFSQRRPWLPLVLVAGVAAELFVPWPLQAAPPVPEAYRQLALMPRAAVVELLFNYEPHQYFAHCRFLFGSTYHWQPLLNGYSDLIPPDYPGIADTMTRFPDDLSFAMLKARGVRYVVVHLNDYEPPFRERLLARFPPYEKYLKRLTTDRDVWLYEIVDWPPAPRGGGTP